MEKSFKNKIFVVVVMLDNMEANKKESMPPWQWKGG